MTIGNEREHIIAVPRIWYNRDGAGPFTWDDPRLEKPSSEEELDEFRGVARGSYGHITVSTIFLGVDLNVLFGDRPLLFETVVWDAHHEIVDMRRYPSEPAARAGHMDMCRKWKDYDPDARH
ncbi:MAG TPA: hypothetical protein VM387_07550 [Gemmatimonadales bacterium]|jgi:hypothetical protein|nr:hypothetical protein [Gemmatimonadales bacterium]